MVDDQEHEINFDLEPVQVKVTVKGKLYWLTEASGDAETKHQACLFRGTSITKDGKVTGIEGMADAEPLLVSRCLYEAGPNGELRMNQEGEPDQRFLVPERKIRFWPTRIKKNLYDRIKRMSGMNDEEETRDSLLKKRREIDLKLDTMKDGEEGDPAKNSSSGGEGGSGSPAS